ncbi:MAG: hypothetical protein PWP64_1381 [Candidatus Cloacimonadota bacterium]|nr:hypothetical protein [Candidatus Cloacimonadota bacterium]
MKINKLNLLTILLISIAVIFLGFTVHDVFSPHDSTEHVVRIQQGDSALTIGKRLEEAGIISSAGRFRLLAKLRSKDRQLKPGTYVFGGNTSLWDTVSRLQEGVSEQIRITIPEGLSLHRTILLIEASGLADYDQLYAAATDTALVRRITGLPLPSLEGYLYPETYLFPVPSTPDSILALMGREFFRKMHLNGIEAYAEERFYQKLILASIVEKEAGNDDERATVAGVFDKRLRLGMALQSCSTVDYILERRGIRREVLTTADTEIESPYNTYQNPGLPPTPVSNPSIASIKAALNPEQHDFLYFFSDRKGNNVFSRSYQEHLNQQRKMHL